MKEIYLKRKEDILELAKILAVHENLEIENAITNARLTPEGKIYNCRRAYIDGIPVLFSVQLISFLIERGAISEEVAQ